MSPSLIFLAFFAAYLWLVVRSFRVGTGTGIATFLFWPIGIIGAIREREILWPFLATLVAFLGVYFFALPRLVESTSGPGAGAALYAAAENPVNAAPDAAPPADGFAESLRLQQAVGRIGFQAGEVAIAEAHAMLAVPEHFRFAPRAYVQPIAEEFGEGAREGLVGWLVHESVDLADDDAWYIEVTWDGRGHYGEGDPALLDASTLLPEMRRYTERFSREDNDGEVAYELVGLEHPPHWDPGARMLTWGERLAYADTSAQLLDCYAARPGREGVFHFIAEYMDTKRAELCLRSVRLMAARTRFAPGHDYGDYSRWRDESSGYDLVDLVSGKAYVD